MLSRYSWASVACAHTQAKATLYRPLNGGRPACREWPLPGLGTSTRCAWCQGKVTFARTSLSYDWNELPGLKHQPRTLPSGRHVILPLQLVGAVFRDGAELIEVLARHFEGSEPEPAIA